MLDFQFVVPVLVATVNTPMLLYVEQQAFVFGFRIILQQGSAFGKGFCLYRVISARTLSLDAVDFFFRVLLALFFLLQLMQYS